MFDCVAYMVLSGEYLLGAASDSIYSTCRGCSCSRGSLTWNWRGWSLAEYFPRTFFCIQIHFSRTKYTVNCSHSKCSGIKRFRVRALGVRVGSELLRVCEGPDTYHIGNLMPIARFMCDRSISPRSYIQRSEIPTESPATVLLTITHG